MIGFLGLFVALASAQGLPDLPVPEEPASGECHRSFPLRAGTSSPTALISADGLARCSAVAEPLSSYAHLLKMEVHAKTVRDLYALDVGRLEAENRSLRVWYRRPWFVAVTTSLLVGGAVVAYDWGTGGLAP